MLDEEQISRIETLAQLELTEEERKAMGEDLENILDHFEKLEELDTTDVDPLMHILDLNNVLREDKTRETLSREEALKNAPKHRGGFFEVPRVIQEGSQE